MTPQQIKSKLILQAGSITAAAKAIRENPDAISATIYYHRLNERIRTKLAKRFGVRFSKRQVRVNELRKAV